MASPPLAPTTEDSVEYICLSDPAVDADAMTSAAKAEYVESFDRELLVMKQTSDPPVVYHMRPLTHTERSRALEIMASGGVPGSDLSVACMMMGLVGVSQNGDFVPAPRLQKGLYTIVPISALDDLPDLAVLEVGTAIWRLSSKTDASEKKSWWRCGPR